MCCVHLIGELAVGKDVERGQTEWVSEDTRRCSRLKPRFPGIPRPCPRGTDDLVKRERERDCLYFATQEALASCHFFFHENKIKLIISDNILCTNSFGIFSSILL